MLTLLCALLTAAAPPTALDYDRAAKDARDILAELVAADTTNPPGNEARVVKVIARWLKRAGVPFQITTFEPGRENLVARLKGDGSRQPVLFLAHTDVVGTRDQTWGSPPHVLTEKDGYLVGRGSGDDLGMVAVDAALAIALHAAHVPLRRDLIVAFTGDEESGGKGIRWQLEHAPETLQAEVAFNEGGGPTLGADGKVQLVRLQMAQKIYQDFWLTAEGATGHSSVPVPGNAIAVLGRALAAIDDDSFPERLNPVTRAYFAGRAKLEPGPLGEAMARLAESQGPPPEAALAVLRKEPLIEAQLRTTCTPTMVSGGTRANALPAKAEANVNCRLLPDDTVDAVLAELRRVAGPGVAVKPIHDFGASGPAGFEGLGPTAVAEAAHEMWPNAAILPAMSTGGNDSRFLIAKGIQSYGLLPLPIAQSDQRRAHGSDERIPVDSLRSGVEFFDRLIRALNE